MGRPKKHLIDDAELLASVYREIDATRRHWEAKRDESLAIHEDARGKDSDLYSKAWRDHWEAKRELENITEDGIAYRLDWLTGKETFTESERTLYRAAIRRLHSAGLIELVGLRATAVKETPAGRAAIAQAAQADALATVNDISPAAAQDAPANE